MAEGKRGQPRRIQADPGTDPLVAQLASQWPSLDRFQKGDAIVVLHRRYPFRQLEGFLPCKEKRMRDLELFGWVLPDKREALTGIGTKRFVASRRALRKLERERDRFFSRLKKISKGRLRRKFLDKLTRTFLTWLEQEMNAWAWDPFVDEILNNFWRDEMRKHKPAWSECQPDGDWEKIINDTRPARDPHADSGFYTGAHFNYHAEWLARWYQRCLPIPEIEQTALEHARKMLREKLKELGPGEQWHARLY